MTTGDRQAAALRTGSAAKIGLFLGPALALTLAFLPTPDGLDRTAMLVAAVLAMMAVWWATEAVPIAITSLVPLALLPLTGALPIREITAPYADPVVLLLLGGFIIAIGIEKWNLHRRIALNVLMVSGARLKLLAAGFMIATALLSMWISNTATTLMMAPIAISVAFAAGGGARLATALLLGIAYSASIGGAATPVGTPTNLIAIAWLRENAGIEINFRQWMSVGLPVVFLMLPFTWLIVTWGLKSDAEAAKAASGAIRDQRDALGRITRPEARVAMVFAAVALAWMLREQLMMLPLFAGLTDMGIAVTGAIAMFLVPNGSRDPEHQGRNWALLTWNDAKVLPWDVMLLFGGGLSIAAAVQASGLAGWLGDGLSGLAGVPMIVLLLVLVSLIIFLTEIMSNVAAVTTFLPVLGALAVAIGMDVQSLVIPVAIAASCAFMLPIATGPNAVVFGTHQFTIGTMIRTGLLLNFACIFVISLFFSFLA